MRGPQVTIKDIARELQISPSTVSRALKDHPDISKDTKKAVNELAKKLNYTPNAVALSLRKSKTNTIGVIIPEIVHFFFSTVISGIEEVAYNAGYNVMVCQSNESYEREVTDIQALLGSRVDGMLVSISKETKNMEHLKEIKERGIPLVFFDRILEDFESSMVEVDDEIGAYQATTHLIEQGYKRIAHLMGPETLIIGRRRYEGYVRALKEHGVNLDEDLIYRGNHSSKEESEAIVRKALDGTSPPDAIFAHSDMTAFGAILAAKKKGLRIPEDFGVVGFSNWQFSEFVSPSLTTVLQPGYEMGRMAAKIFLNEVDRKEVIDFQKITLGTQLIVRESSIRKK
jgi:LacI family transcriptional regulator